MNLKTLLLYISLSTQAIFLHCVPGVLDTTFGTNGVTTTSVGRIDFITSCTVQPDNKIIVTGASNGFTQRLVIARYTATGSLDTSFNTTGANFLTVGTKNQAQATTLQADGSILTCGSTFQSKNNALIARFTASGPLDTTFNTMGFVTASIGTGSIANSVKVQTDTNIVVAGGAFVGQAVFALARFTASGALDGTFGTGGEVFTPIGIQAVINQIALQSDGKIVAAGYAAEIGTTSFCVARYNTNGTLDTGFGSGGIVTTIIGSESRAYSVLIQPDNTILVAGYAIESGITKFALVRYNSNGTLDTTFNPTGSTPGVVTTAIQYKAEANSVILQADNKIIAGGCSFGDQATQFALARYTTAGALDSTFGTNGIVLTTIPLVNGEDSESRIKSLVLQSDGKIIATGYSNTNFALARYLAA